MGGWVKGAGREKWKGHIITMAIRPSYSTRPRLRPPPRSNRGCRRPPRYRDFAAALFNPPPTRLDIPPPSALVP